MARCDVCGNEYDKAFLRQLTCTAWPEPAIKLVVKRT